MVNVLRTPERIPVVIDYFSFSLLLLLILMMLWLVYRIPERVRFVGGEGSGAG